VLTTIYGQLVSVYQYPKAVLLVLGGSTLAAMAIGLTYGREKRVWCKYLCPVNGVFGLLARLAPLRYRVDEAAWRASYTQGEHGHRVIPINCAPLVPLRAMQGAADCHMCGRCSGHRAAVQLTLRSPSEEVVRLGEGNANPWDTALLLFGLCGVAIGAFHWTASPWFITLKQATAGWLIDHNLLWPLDTNAPWFILTHYVAQNDVFSWLDGAMILSYIGATAVCYGSALAMSIGLATRTLGPWRMSRFHHLAQSLIPVASCGVFLGLTSITLALLRAEHVWLDWVPYVRWTLLAGANLWSLWLAWGVIGRHTTQWHRRIFALTLMGMTLLVFDSAWWLMFHVW
jgi:polyferredoxin